MRHRTRELHVDLERGLRLGAADAGRPQYADHVAAMWGWLQPLELQLWQWHWPALVEASLRHGKSVWLQQDIQAAQADGFAPNQPMLCEHAMDLTSPAARYGWAYVIEGSMLGGQVLHRRLASRLHPWPMRYLQGYGPAGGRLWKNFLQSLDREVRSPEDIHAASEAAALAFTSVGNWFRERGVA